MFIYTCQHVKFEVSLDERVTSYLLLYVVLIM